jgi:periplasmic divalent cation tolerance protein
MTSARIAITTAGSLEEADRVARTLVEERLAACVNIIESVRSIYRWQGKLESAGELLLLIKTDVQHLDLLQKRLTELHSYDLPEFLVLEVSAGSEAYLHWITTGLR